METNLNEMTKTELHKMIRWGAKDLRHMNVSPTYNYDDNANYFAIREVYDKYQFELEKRGATKTDQRVIDAYFNAKWQVSKLIDKAMEAAC